MSYRSCIRVSALAAAVLLGACKEGAGPEDRLTLQIAAARTNEVTETGQFTLGLVVSDGNGNLIPPGEINLAATLSDGSAVSLVSLSPAPPNPQPLAAVINIDDSNSMVGNDGQRYRAAAAQLFWETLIGANPANQVSLWDFSGRPSSAGFRWSRMLQDWTSDVNALAAQLPNIQPYTEDPATPLYRSAVEVQNWIDQTRPAASYQRVMLVLTDGIPTGSDSLARQEALDNAVQKQIVIHTVGLGPASDIHPRSNPAAVARLQELASVTGGVYSGAREADDLEAVFRTLAEVSLQGQLLAVFQLSQPPAPGTQLTVRLTASRTTSNAEDTEEYTFVAP